MRNLNFLRKSERKSVGTTLALTVGSPSAHRRYSALKHLAFMLLFLLGSLNVWGDSPYEHLFTSSTTSPFSSAQSGVKTQNATLSGVSWTITTAQAASFFAQTTTTGLQVGSKANQSGNFTLSTSGLNDYTITQVEVECSRATNSTATLSVTVGENALGTQNQNLETTASALTFSNQTGYSGDIVLSFTNPTVNNKSTAVYIKRVTITYTTGGSSQPSLSSIEVSGTPSKKTYELGETFDPAGLTVTAHYDDDTDDDVTEDVEWSFDPAIFTEAGSNKSVTVTASYEDKEDSETYNGITVTEHVVTPGTYNVVPNNAFWGRGSQNGSQAVAANALNISVASDDVTYNLKNNSSTNSYMKSDHSRAYNGYTLTLSVPSGFEMTAISFTGDTWVAPTANVGTMSSKSWTGKANLVTFTFSGTSYMSEISVTYAAEVKSAVSFSAPTGGTLVIKDGDDAISSDDLFSEGKTLSVDIAPTGTYIGGAVKVIKTGVVPEEDVTDDVLEDGVLTVPAYAITVSASFTLTYAIELVADGGSIALDYTAAGAPEGRAIAGTEIMATATPDANHTFKSLVLSENVTIKEIDGNVATFTMPAGDVTVTATFDEKADPYITLSQTEDYLFEDVAEGASTNMTFTVSGANLSNNLSVAVSGGDAAKFELSATSITISEGSVTNYEVTVTPVTSAAGTFGTTIIVDDGENGAPAQSFDVAITVLPKYTAKWIVNGDAENPYSSQTAIEGADLNIPNNPAATGNCAGLTFMGWVSEAIEGSQDEAPSYVNTEGLTMPNNDVTYYAVFAEETPGEDEIETYSHTIEAKTWSSAGAQTLSSVAWTLANNGNYYNYDGTKGQQVGSGGAPASAMSLTTSGISGKITSVKIYTSGANSVSATVAASVNGVAYKIDNSTSPVAISSTNTGYEFTGSETGEIVISWAQTSSKALYFKQIEVKYATPGAPTYSNYVTTCSTCAKVTMSAAEVEHGSIALQQDSKAVEVVKTCDEAQSVDVVATPATGYELSGVDLSGTAAAKASYSNGVISIEKDAEGTLVATASFSQANYSVTMAQTGGAEATISGDQSNKHFGDEITVTATTKDGYVFVGWEASTAVEFANAKALSTTFSMPNGNVTVTAKYSKILTVAEALALIPNSGDNSDGDVFVQSFVSYVDGSSFDANYGTMHYYLSDNGARQNELMVYYGYKGKNNEGFVHFEASNDIKAGDKVIVCGPLTNFNGTKEYKTKSSYIHELTSASHASYEIVGELTQNAFAAGDEFLDSYLANLKVNDVYNTGYKVEVADVTFSANKTALVAEDEAVHVTATKDEITLAEKDFAITVSSATLVSFALKDGYKTEYYEGETFVKPTVIATLSDESHVEAEALSCTGYNMSEAGNYEVTVSYKYGDITLNNVQYNITVKAVFDNEDAPHTVAVAKSLIEASEYQSTTSSTKYMWVSGKVVSDPNNSSTYYISDDGTSANQLTVWQGKYFTPAVNAKGNVVQGDEVILKATIVNYNGSQAELTASTVVYQLREPQFAIANVAEMEVNVTEDIAVAGLEVTKDGEGVVTLTESSNTDAVTIAEGKLHAAGAGEATITANLAATNNSGSINYSAKTTTFTVNVIAERARYSVTFANGGATEGSAPQAIDPQLAEAKVYLPENTYSWANHGFNGWAVTKTVSGDAVEIAEDANGKYIVMPEAAVTITATWVEIATTKISFMVGGVEKASIDKEQDVAFTIAQDGSAWAPTGFTFVGWATEEQAEETEVAPTTITEYTPQAGISAVSLYGIYSRVEGEGETNHYVLDYAADGIGEMTLGYGNAVNVTATDGSQWVVKAFKSQGMQLNSGANSSIKIPNCSGNIVSIAVTGNASKAIGFSESDYSGNGTITYVVQGTDATSQNLSFAGKTVKAGYIVPVSKANQITHIDVAYDAAKTYYTSSPVEKVTITFNANGGNGGCTKAVINKGSEFTICENVPTKTHSEFAGWKLNETTTIYQANQNIGEVEEDITLTAQWEDAATYDVTYNVNGSSDAAPTQEAQYAGDQFEVGAAVTKEGFTFQGWKYGSKLYKAGASFTMPAEAVEFVAQWRKASVPVDKMSMVTSASALSNGMQIALGCSYVKDEVSYFAMAGDIASGKSFLSSETESITLSNGVATYTEDVVIMTLEQVANGWKIAKDETHYLTSSGADIKWDTQANATVWTIIFEGNNVVIANGNNKMKFNSQSPRFKTYTSAMTAIQLFGKAIVIDQGDSEDPVNVSVSELGFTEGEAIIASGEDVTLTIDVPTVAPSITAQNGATVVIDEPTTTESVVVEDGSKIVANAETTAPTVYFSTTMGSTQVPGTASELGSVTNITLATGGEIIYDLTLGTSMAGIQADPNQWHAFTLPFAVDAINGIYDAETGAKLQNEVNYAIMDYHGDIRANGDYGWKKYRGILQPGVFYIMTVDGNTKTFRFKASKVGAMTQTTSMGYKAYNGSGDPSKDFGWNGIGNPSWVSGTVTVNVQVLDPYSYTYQPLTINTNITVSTPFFYNAGGDGSTGSVVMQDAGTGANYAPARTPANEIKNVAVSFGNEVFRDKIYISASEDALNTYEQDKDLVRMIMSNTPKVAQIFGNAYGMKLSMVNAPMVNDQATYGLTLYAPAAGEYTISAPAMDNADLYLTQNGAIIWNLSMGEYTSDFAKGNNEGYGLLLVKKAPQVTTGVENAEANETGVQKVIINEHVYILRAEQMYDVTGKLVK